MALTLLYKKVVTRSLTAVSADVMCFERWVQCSWKVTWIWYETWFVRTFVHLLWPIERRKITFININIEFSKILDMFLQKIVLRQLSLCICTSRIWFVWQNLDKKEEIWLNPLTKFPTPLENWKRSNKTNTPSKCSITQWLSSDLGLSVGVTTTTHQVWLTGLDVKWCSSYDCVICCIICWDEDIIIWCIFFFIFASKTGLSDYHREHCVSS